MAKGKETTVTFTSASAKGLKVTAVKPGTGKGKKFTFPAKVKGSKITHKGGLTLTNASDPTKSLTIEKIVLNTKTNVGTVSVAGNPIDAFVLAKVKTKKGNHAERPAGHQLQGWPGSGQHLDQVVEPYHATKAWAPASGVHAFSCFAKCSNATST